MNTHPPGAAWRFDSDGRELRSEREAALDAYEGLQVPPPPRQPTPAEQALGVFDCVAGILVGLAFAGLIAWAYPIVVRWLA